MPMTVRTAALMLVSFVICALAKAEPAPGSTPKQWTVPDGGILRATQGVVPQIRTGRVSPQVIYVLPTEASDAPASKRAAPTLTTFKSTITIGRTRYSFIMVGSNPFVKGAKSVAVTLPIIPVVLQFTDGTVLDPTIAGGGCAGGTSALDLTLQSPLFQSLDYGEGVRRQFVEEVRRMEFWGYTGPGRLNPNYSVRVNPVLLPPLRLTPTAEVGITEPGQCGRIGHVWGPSFDLLLRTVILPQLPKFGVGKNAFPVFLLLNTVTDFPGVTAAGFHSQMSVGGQTYGVSLFDSSGSISPDVSVLSHEIAEWYDDPYGNNLTPSWGHTGQVEAGCQNNLEVGDPLTRTLWPPIVLDNGFSYHMQETAFFSWFFRQVPSIGLGGWYSSFGSFLEPSAPCP